MLSWNVLRGSNEASNPTRPCNRTSHIIHSKARLLARCALRQAPCRVACKMHLKPGLGTSNGRSSAVSRSASVVHIDAQAHIQDLVGGRSPWSRYATLLITSLERRLLRCRAHEQV